MACRNELLKRTAVVDPVALGERNIVADAVAQLTDKAAQVCPTGAILIKNQGYGSPIGARLYDQESVKVMGDVAQVPESEGGRRHE